MREFLLEPQKVSKRQKLLKSCRAQSEKAYSRQEEKKNYLYPGNLTLFCCEFFEKNLLYLFDLQQHVALSVGCKPRGCK